MKDLILYQCRKLLASCGSVDSSQDRLMLTDAKEETLGTVAAYLELLGLWVEAREEASLLLSGEGGLSVALAYSAEAKTLCLTVEQK